MIKWIKQGDIFQSPCEVLVNPVNCVGIMGAGLAKQFKERWPKYFADYKFRCMQKKLHRGMVYLWEGEDQKILTFPTKYHWRQDADLFHLSLGLKNFCAQINGGVLPSTSYAFPALGAGLGGLEWEPVHKLLDETLSTLKIDMEVYFPYADVRVPMS
jgi:O-acetyl-ADP-ribose deacetylase (regulator of RNase III)